MAPRQRRRLPDIRFETPPRELDEILPRMDIAAFVGFAATGPTHVPVPVESLVEFTAIFGGEVPIAWDPERGELLSARLAPAVAAFFRNGGIRCWVVRVAAGSTSNFFQIPGLARLSNGVMAPAFARGRSDGSWCDSVRVGAAIAPMPIDVAGVTRDGDRLIVDVTVATPADVKAGDLVRLEVAGGAVAMIAVEEVQIADPRDTSPPSDRPRARVSGRASWFQKTPPPLPSSPLSAIVYTATPARASIDDTFAAAPVAILNPPSTWTTFDGAVRLDLQMDPANAPEPGALVSVTVASAQLWLAVRSVGTIEQPGGVDRVRITGAALWFVKTPPPIDLHVVRADRVTLELWVRQGEDQLFGLRDLGFVHGHPRYWAGLKHDDEWYGATERESAAFGELARERRFPLAGAGSQDAMYIPVDLALTPERYLGAMRQPRTSLERDGLADFSPALFLDPDLIDAPTERVQDEAERLRYAATRPRRLTGIHAVIEIDEATIVSAPDAAHRGWVRVPLDPPGLPEPSPSVPPLPFGRFVDCRVRALDTPEWTGNFASQTVVRIDSGSYALQWSLQSGATFVVEEAHRADWSDAIAIQSGPAARLNVYGHPAGISYYRVRAVDGTQTSNWSRGLVVVVAGADAWHVIGERDYSAEALVAVQRALLRMAAARGDLFALLPLPEHYRPDAVASHLNLLTRNDGPAIRVDVGRPEPVFSRPMDLAEARALSYGAIYHPWLILSDQADADLLHVPPDGSVAGLLAHRALTRGAWIAPANEPLAGVVAVSPAISRATIEPLLGAGVNVILQTPRGFLPQSANTLSDDSDLSLINVRRLLSLLRRLALREGVGYVFEPNDPVFQRSVQRGFENLLTYMFERGAFAGDTSTSAFQVNSGPPLNTDRSVDAGRFVVELRVAPSVPMSFLTVRLVQSGDRTLVAEER
jgi:hypothetical protein